MLKRTFDLVFSILIIIITIPIFSLIAFLIKIDSRGPIFYRGIRVGLNGKLFRIYKFRSMIVGAEQLGPSSTASNDIRQTRIGKFIRKYKLDEIPQVLNVFLGDMSFVGPRPQVEWAVNGYSTEERKILEVRPGITDYASIKFHNEGELLKGAIDPDKYYMEKIHPEKMRLALEYVRNNNLWIDVKIIFKTIITIIN